MNTPRHRPGTPIGGSLRMVGDPVALPPGLPLMAMGFRPFFLGAALFGAVVIPVWLLLLTGKLGAGGGLPATWWHAHEMLLGYTGAVLAGFLLTAVRNWTGGRPTAANGSLAVLVGLWGLGRLAHAPGVPGGWWSALPDVAWLLGTTLAIGRPLWAARSWRNYGFLAALPALGAASLGLHLAAAGEASLLRPSLDGPVAIVVVIMVVVAGRIVPMFTRNGLGVETTRSMVVEKTLPYALGAIVVCALTRLPPAVEGAALAATGALLLLRMAGWRSYATRKSPLLWILHGGHAFIGIGLLLQAGAVFAWVSPSAGLHAITAGAIGSLTLGMMARVTLGHTGHALKVDHSTTLAFGLISLSAVLRVIASLVGTQGVLLQVAGSAWSLALLLWLGRNARVLLTRRPDGKPG